MRWLPFGDDRFDAAVMALVLFFVPDPAMGVAEMARVVGPGGTVAAYMWNWFGEEMPTTPIAAELRAVGVTVPMPPSPEVARMEVSRALWAGAGLEAVETREIEVRRIFPDFEACWQSCASFPSSGVAIGKMAPGDVERVKAGLARRLPADASGRVSYSARAYAIKGRLPGGGG